jgi:hypothetical protein
LSFSLREEHRFKLCCYKVLGRIFRPWREKITGENRNLVENPEGKRLHFRSWYRWEDDDMLDLKDGLLGCGWLQRRDLWQVLMDTVMKLLVP